MRAVSSGFSSGKKCPPFIVWPCACEPIAAKFPGPPSFQQKSVKRATLGQQKQHWAFDSLAGFLIDAIVFDVDRYFSSTSTDGLHRQTGTLGLKHPEAARRSHRGCRSRNYPARGRHARTHGQELINEGRDVF